MEMSSYVVADLPIQPLYHHLHPDEAYDLDEHAALAVPVIPHHHHQQQQGYRHPTDKPLPTLHQQQKELVAASDMMAILPPISHTHVHHHHRHHHHHQAGGAGVIHVRTDDHQPQGPVPVAAASRRPSISAHPPQQPHAQALPLPLPIPEAAAPVVALIVPQRPAPVVDAKDRITVRAIPSQTIENGKLVVGSDSSTSVRSYTPLKTVGDGSFGTVVLADWHSPLPPGVSISPMQLNIKSASQQQQQKQTSSTCSSGSSPTSPTNPPTNTSSSAPQCLVAIKQMKKRWTQGWSECCKLKELESLRKITPHPNIIPLYDAFLMPDTRELHFVFECMEGNLYQLIKSRKGRPLAGGLVASIYRQVVLGLIHVHEGGYFHRDMKPENLLVTTTGLADYSPTSPLIQGSPSSAPPDKDVMVIVKLADFGLAREVTSSPPYTEYVSTRWYRAPEVLLRSRDYSVPVDMWALGTIMAELVNLKPIFPGQNEVDQVARITEVLGDPTRTEGEYGLDDRGRVIGGGGWLRGIRMARAVGFTFPKVTPMNFEKLFEPSVPRSLIDCIVDLIRYDPAKRLTAQMCKEHQYWKETENSMRSPITVQPTAPLYPSQPPQPAPSQHQYHQHQYMRPPDTNASSTSSNKSLRAAVAGMGLQSSSHHRRPSVGQGQPQYLGAGGYPLPLVSPRNLPPSHSHPFGAEHGQPSAFNPEADGSIRLPPIASGQHTGYDSQSSSHILANSQSHPNLRGGKQHHLQLMQHRNPTDHSLMSPITPSASPGLAILSSASDLPMSSGAWQYAQAAQAHYASQNSAGGASGFRSHPNSRSGGDLLHDGMPPPPVPRVPEWATQVDRESMVATLGSGTDETVDGRVAGMSDDDDRGAPMDISNRNSLDMSAADFPLPAINGTSLVKAHIVPAPAVQQDVPAPQQQQHHSSKFGLGKSLGFGKKHKTWGLFGHGSDNASVAAAAPAPPPPPPPPPAGMTTSNSMPAAVGGTSQLNSLKRGPSGSTGSLNEFQQYSGHQHQPQPQPPPPAPSLAPTDPKAAKKLAEKKKKEEAMARREQQERAAKERARMVVQKRNAMQKSGVLPKSDSNFEANPGMNAVVPMAAMKEKGKQVDRGPSSDHQQQHEQGGVGVPLGLVIPQSMRKPAGGEPQSAKHLLGPSPESENALSPVALHEGSRRHHRMRDPSGLPSIHSHHPQGHNPGGSSGVAGSSSQHYGAHPYELQLHRHKARRRDLDDDHSMSSSDMHSVSRLSMISLSTVDSDPGPASRNRMGMIGGYGRPGTNMPYGTGSTGIINRATSTSNLRSGSTFDPSATSTSLPAGMQHPGMSTVSPPMQMLSLGNGSQRGTTQSPPPASETGSLRQSISRNRLHQPGSLYSAMPTLPPIASIQSFSSNGDGEGSEVNLTPAYELSQNGYDQSLAQAANGQVLPPFSHIASYADNSPLSDGPTPHDPYGISPPSS